MAETNNIYPGLSASPSNNQQFRLNRINEIKDYLVAEIRERELMSKKLSNYIAFFYHFDNSLIVLSIIAGSVSIVSFATIIRPPAETVIANFNLPFSISK